MLIGRLATPCKCRPCTRHSCIGCAGGQRCPSSRATTCSGTLLAASESLARNSETWIARWFWFFLYLLLLTLPGVHADNGPKPLLEVMYLKYGQQPIDTSPVFDPTEPKYDVVLDWKMKYFSVQAKTEPPAIIENIRLCPQDADCLKQRQRVVRMDFSRNIIVQPGGQVLYKFDVLLHGMRSSYTIKSRRLEGSETYIRHMILQGSTLHPAFDKNVNAYQCLLDVGMEYASMELHLQDGGQVILAEADAPILLSSHDNITTRKNLNPQNTRSPPTRLRRLREEIYGEFQYPNKYVSFAVPLGMKRRITFKVISADGGHFGYYFLELARGSCTAETPLFDAQSGICVSFCNAGFYADHDSHRCKECEDTCISCTSPHRCIRCPAPSRVREYTLDNITGTCIAKERRLWEQHPQHAVALALAIFGFSVFCCGMCLMRLSQSDRGADSARQHMLKADENLGVPIASGALPRANRGGNAPPLGGRPTQDFSSQGRNGSRFLQGGPAMAGYAPVSNWDQDAL